MPATGKSWVVLALAASGSLASASEYNGEFRKPAPASGTDQIIVKWRSGTADVRRLQKAANLDGTRFLQKQRLDETTDVIRLATRLTAHELDDVLEQLRGDPDVEFASPDLRRHPHALTNDALLNTQWYLLGEQPSATRTDAAWDITTASSATVVAVLDTGVRFEHPDLRPVAEGGKLLVGHDFVSRAPFANDGDGRDADASDPGDWVDANDLTQPGFGDCEQLPSSWHGTRVAGLVGALTNNLEGVAGAAFNARVLPVRVMGKCGGFDSDIIAGMRWAAGLPVAGVPANPTPATVINLSLGGDGACSAAYQSAVDEINARGVVIVVSAGNDGGPVNSPANCAGVVGVGGIRHVGTKVGFSSLGPGVAISAPGGNCVNTGPGQPCLFSIVVASNTGTTTPATSSYTDPVRFNVGTSFAAPQVASAIALMRSVNSRLSPAQLSSLARESASAFPVSTNTAISECRVPASDSDLQTTECNCTTQTCGAGMLNTAAAVAAAQSPVAVLRTEGQPFVGSTLTLNSESSFASDGRTLASFQWSVENITGAAPAIASASQQVTTMSLPGTAQFTLRLTVTDDRGARDVEVLAMEATTPPPPPANSDGGGGGGQLSWELLALTALLRRRLVTCCSAVCRPGRKGTR